MPGFLHAEHQAAFDDCPISLDIVLCTDGQIITDVNSRAAARMGFSRDELVGAPLSRCLTIETGGGAPPPDRWSGRATRASRAGGRIPVAVATNPWPHTSIPASDGTTDVVAVVDLAHPLTDELAGLGPGPVAVLRSSPDWRLLYYGSLAARLLPALAPALRVGAAVALVPSPTPAAGGGSAPGDLAGAVTLVVGDRQVPARVLVEPGPDGFTLWCQDATVGTPEHERTLPVGPYTRALLQLTRSAVLIVDQKLVPVWSSAVVRTAFPFHDLRRDSLAQVAAPPTDVLLAQAGRQLLDHPDGRSSERIALANPDGYLTWVEVGMVNRLDDPRIGGIVMTLRDVTESLIIEASWAANLVTLREAADQDSPDYPRAAMAVLVDTLNATLALHRPGLSASVLYRAFGADGTTAVHHTCGSGTAPTSGHPSLAALEPCPAGTVHVMAGPGAGQHTWVAPVTMVEHGVVAAVLVTSPDSVVNLGRLQPVMARAVRQVAMMLVCNAALYGPLRAGMRVGMPERRLGEAGAAARLDELVTAYMRVSHVRERALRRSSLVIHDGPAQELAVATWLLEDLIEDHPDIGEEAAEALAGLRAHLLRANIALREVITELRAPVGGDHLIVAVEQAGQAMLGSKVTVTVENGLRADPGPGLTPLIYRTTMEALRNISRHASASAVLVRYVQTDAQLVLDVIDDGVGFDPAVAAARAAAGHIGLASMRDDVALAGGTLTIGCRDDGARGTQLTCRIPTLTVVVVEPAL